MSQSPLPAPEFLEWTISEAFDFGEPEASPLPPVTVHPSPRPRLQLSVTRRSGFILLASLSGLGLLFSLCPGLSQIVIRQQLAQMVQLEDDLALAGQNVQLESLSDGVWLKRQAAITAAGDLIPRPLPMLLPVREAGQMRSWRWIASNLARVEVLRRFTAPDGQTYSFIVPQYYQYVSGAWKRVAAPPPEARAVFRGRYLEMVYAETEADLVAKALVPYLESALERACAIWGCPEGFKIGVSFGAQPRTFYPNAPLPDDPLLFSQSPLIFNRSPHNTLMLPAPSVMGYPVDDQAVDLFKRAVTAQALLVVADGVLFSQGERDLARNAFLYALVARLGAQLGLEAPTVFAIRTSPLTRTPEVLWDIGVGGTPRSGDEMRRALAMLNWILRERPSEADMALFDALRQAEDPDQWLSLGLGLTPEDAQATWEAAETQTFDVNMGYQVNRPPDFGYAAALGCNTGPALLMGDDSVFRPLPNYGTWATALAVAPDHQRVALSLAGQPAILDFTAERVYALPNATPGNLIRLAWLDDSRVAYVMYPNFWSRQFTLNFFDAAAPQQPARTLPDIMEYVLAPDQAQAAIVASEFMTNIGLGLQGILGLMPAEGGNLQRLDIGVLPTWSPDGTQLAYLHDEGLPGDSTAARHQFDLRLADISTGLTRTLFSFAALGPDAPTPFSTPVWSPDGKQIAFTAVHGDELDLVLVSLDGAYQSISLGPNVYYATQVSYLPDGRGMAVTRFGEDPDVSTLIYFSGRHGPERLPFEGTLYSSPWDQAILWSQANRLSLTDDSANLNNGLKLVLNDECDAAWAMP